MESAKVIPQELEKYRAQCAANGLTTVVDYQEMTLTVIEPETYETEVHKLDFTFATYYVL